MKIDPTIKFGLFFISIVIFLFIMCVFFKHQVSKTKSDPCRIYRTEMKTVCDTGTTEVCLRLQMMYCNCLTINKILKPTKKEKTIESPVR